MSTASNIKVNIKHFSSTKKSVFNTAKVSLGVCTEALQLELVVRETHVFHKCKFPTISPACSSKSAIYSLISILKKHLWKVKVEDFSLSIREWAFFFSHPFFSIVISEINH